MHICFFPPVFWSILLLSVCVYINIYIYMHHIHEMKEKQREPSSWVHETVRTRRQHQVRSSIFNPIGTRCTKSLEICIKLNFSVSPDTLACSRQLRLKTNGLRSLRHCASLYVWTYLIACFLQDATATVVSTQTARTVLLRNQEPNLLRLFCRATYETPSKTNRGFYWGKCHVCVDEIKIFMNSCKQICLLLYQFQ